MQEIQVPSGVKVELAEGKDELVISGKLGSTRKKVNRRLLTVSISGDKILLSEVKHKKLAKKAALASQALSSEIKRAIAGVEGGLERHMKVVFAHFPMAIEVKGDGVFAKNVFGEKKPRVAKIVGTTKVEIKGQDITVKGVDPYDVGQTAANINRLSFARRKDSRVFQDGIFFVQEE
ncbi:MAG: 50S ribosomal protein L6 [Candidatus Micrarchaeota archaeon]|nr:50S ribosomal protein L6 [Candidatus Micrarchaeota archaeon]